MYCPRLTDEEKELVNKLESLPDKRFKDCMFVLGWHEFHIEIKNKEVRKTEAPDKFFLKQGRNKARYYADMRLSNAVMELEEAKKEVENVRLNWEKMEHDAPIYWDNVKTKDGWKKVLVGNAARDYDQETDPNTGRAKLYFPNGEVTE